MNLNESKKEGWSWISGKSPTTIEKGSIVRCIDTACTRRPFLEVGCLYTVEEVEVISRGREEHTILVLEEDTGREEGELISGWLKERFKLASIDDKISLSSYRKYRMLRVEKC